VHHLGYQLQALLLGDSSFEYFDDLPYSQSPALPLLACFRRGRFEDCTAEFPEFIRSDVDGIGYYAKKLRDDGSDRGAALGIYAG
jgi:hypothetical protein